ncbi:MAG TPA: helix-turn-helix transcriptional regulator [Candidatus Limnocylindrales bacterium]|nr:helix-turn-helix transcriptional regulator [Candidatus Limnocylindrales bacterium]
MPPTQLQRAAARRTSETRRALATQLLHLREDAGITQAELASAVGLSQGYIAQIEAGLARPTIETYTALSMALGSDLSVRIYPNTGPAIRDRQQAPIVEALLRLIGPRWRAFPEVPVRAPTRGVVDLVLHREGPPSVIVASEIESEIRRLEQRLRWHAEKAAAMPSSDVWAAAVAAGGPVPAVSRLLILRSTRANRQIARDFEQTLRAAYPASASDCFRALRGDAPWPGPSILWASTDREPTRILEHPPRGVGLGRDGSGS